MHGSTFTNEGVCVIQNAGFFSCCSVRLGSIIKYFNTYKKCPLFVDSSRQFKIYKESDADVTFHYFQKYDSGTIHFEHDIDYEDTKQFSEYKHLDFKNIHPFVSKYFSPSPIVVSRIEHLLEKYSIQLENTCALFHRGNDKSSETQICSYDEKIEQAQKILIENPNIRFLIQSDETEFIEKALATFPNNSFYMKNEIYHIPSNASLLIDYVFRENILERAENFLAVMFILSRCKHVILSSGNCDIWITLFRGHADNVTQYNHGKWVYN